MEEQLNRKAREGLTRRLAQGQPSRPEPDYWQRLDYELKCLAQMGFAGYFLVVADIINYARKKHIPVGPGRGSAAGSLVAYSLGITDLDPLAYGLIFERFLNPERVSPPDIDMDFCYERRNEVIHYVAKTYGWENVAQITTFGSMKSRQVIRDVGRALEVPYAEVDRIAKLVPEQLKMTIAKALEQEPRLREARDTSPTVADILTVAKTLEGLPRHASTHAAGLVIADRPIVEYLPLYKGSKGELVTQFDMKGVERVGLVKFDFLGLRTLTVIDQAVRFVRQNHDKNFDIHTIPLNDPETFALLQVANTGGVFQLESDGMRALMVRLKPTTFEDIIALVALYRPGPMESGMIDDYVRRKHGEEPVDLLPAPTRGHFAGNLRDYSLSGAGDADRRRGLRLFPGRGRHPAPGHGEEDRRGHGGPEGALRHRGRGPGHPQGQGRLSVHPDRKICRLRLQQVPQRRLRPGGLPDRVSQGPLSPGISGGAVKQRNHPDHLPGQAHHGGPGPGASRFSPRTSTSATGISPWRTAGSATAWPG